MTTNADRGMLSVQRHAVSAGAPQQSWTGVISLRRLRGAFKELALNTTPIKDWSMLGCASVLAGAHG